jgi:4-aminobutyrate aminotransferase-like enzyme
MKGICKVSVVLTDFMDPEAPPKQLALIAVPQVGDVEVKITRNAMGVIVLEGATVTPNPAFKENLEEFVTQLKRLQEVIGMATVQLTYTGTEAAALALKVSE